MHAYDWPFLNCYEESVFTQINQIENYKKKGTDDKNRIIYQSSKIDESSKWNSYLLKRQRAHTCWMTVFFFFLRTFPPPVSTKCAINQSDEICWLSTWVRKFKTYTHACLVRSTIAQLLMRYTEFAYIIKLLIYVDADWRN